MSNCTFANAFYGIALSGELEERVRAAMVAYTNRLQDYDNGDFEGLLSPEEEKELVEAIEEWDCRPLFPPGLAASLAQELGLPSDLKLCYVDEERLISYSGMEGGEILLGYGVTAFPDCAAQACLLKDRLPEADWLMWCEAEC